MSSTRPINKPSMIPSYGILVTSCRIPFYDDLWNGLPWDDLLDTALRTHNAFLPRVKDMQAYCIHVFHYYYFKIVSNFIV